MVPSRPPAESHRKHFLLQHSPLFTAVVAPSGSASGHAQRLR